MLILFHETEIRNEIKYSNVLSSFWNPSSNYLFEFDKLQSTVSKYIFSTCCFSSYNWNVKRNCIYWLRILSCQQVDIKYFDTLQLDRFKQIVWWWFFDDIVGRYIHSNLSIWLAQQIPNKIRNGIEYSNFLPSSWKPSSNYLFELVELQSTKVYYFFQLVVAQYFKHTTLSFTKYWTSGNKILWYFATQQIQTNSLMMIFLMI